MDEFEIPPAKKPRLEVQPGGPLKLASSTVDDMEDFYDTPCVGPGGSRSPTKVSDELLHRPGVTSGTTSFSLPGLQTIKGGGNDLDANSVEEAKDVVIEEAGNVPNGALEVDLKHTNPTGGAGVSACALEGHGDSHSLTRPPDDTDVGVGSNDGVSVDNAQNTIGKADLDQTEQVQVRPSEAVDVSATSNQSNDQTNWEQAPAVQAEIHVPPEEWQHSSKQSDSTSNEPGAPVRDLPMITPTHQDELSVVAVPMGLQAGNTDVHSDIGDHLQPFAIPVAWAELPSESNLPVDLTTEQQVGISNVRNAEAEFELDSSPIESSSKDSSDSSSEDSGDNSYKMLDPAEQARLLMQEDGGSDDDGRKKGAASAPLRTLNEKPDEIVEKPNITVTEDILIEELGEAETIVENLVLIKAKTPGEYQVLETGSLLCLKDRTVIGVVAETLGRVQQPLYTIRFTNVAAISESGISKSTAIYYVPQHSTFVFTQAIKAIKGSDASNIHDEEVGDDELEFSDDEAEAEFKRNQKLQRQAKRGGCGASTNGYLRRPPENGFSDGNRNGNAERSQADVASISYDDDVGGDEDLYTPLTRPSNLHELPGPGVHGETSSGSRHYDRGGHGSRSRRGNSRGRGDRGRGDRGKGDYGRGDRWKGRDRGDRQAGFNPNRGDRQAGFNGNRGERQGSAHSDDSRPPPVPDLSLPPAPPPPRPSYSMGPPQPPVLPPSFTPSYPSFQPQQASSYQPFSQGYTSGQPQYPCHQGQPAPQQPQVANFQPSQQQYDQQSHYSQQPYPLVNPGLNGQPPPSQATPPLPPGSFVNPAFFSKNFQQPPRQQQYPPRYNGYSGGQR